MEVQKERINKKTKTERENILLKEIFINGYFYIKDWDENKEKNYNIPKNSIPNYIKSLKQQNIIVGKGKKSIKYTFTPNINDLVLIIKEKKDFSLSELEKYSNNIDIVDIIDRFSDARIIKKYSKEYDVYMKIS